MEVKLTVILCALILYFDFCFAQIPQNNPNNPFISNGQTFAGNNQGQPTFPGNNNFNGQQNQGFAGNNIPGQQNPGIAPINPNTLGVNPQGVNNQIGGFPGNNNPPGVAGIATFQPGFQTLNAQFQNPFITGGNNFGQGFGPNVPGGFGPGNTGPGGQLLMSLSQNYNNYRYATCYFNVTKGSSIMGRADFRQFIFGEWPVEIRIQVAGLPTSPVDTQRGIHIHEYGDTGGKCARVGPHFNPTLTRHGGRDTYPFLRHVGDLGNMLQSPRGVTSTQFRDRIISLQGQNNIIGRSLVIKYERDDEGTRTNARSQVDGNARTPVACCTIGRAGPGNWQDPYTEEELMAMTGGVWNTGTGGSGFGGNTPFKNTGSIDIDTTKPQTGGSQTNAGGNTFGSPQNIGSLNAESFNGGSSPVGGNSFNGNMGGNTQTGNLAGNQNTAGVNTNMGFNTNNNQNNQNSGFTFGTQNGGNTNTAFNTNTNNNNNNQFTFGTQTGTQTGGGGTNAFGFLGGNTNTGKKRRKRSSRDIYVSKK